MFCISLHETMFQESSSEELTEAVRLAKTLLSPKHEPEVRYVS